MTSADGLVVEELAVEQLAGADLGTARRRHGLRRFLAIRSGLIGSVGVLVVVLLAIFGPCSRRTARMRLELHRPSDLRRRIY